MRLGVHVPIAGGILESIGRAKALACTTMQIFSRSPRGGSPAPLLPEVLERFHAGRLAAGLDPLVIHAPYIINLASPDAGTWQRSVALYREDFARAKQLRAHYVVTHVGSHRGQGEALGIARVAEAIDRTLDDASDDGPMIVLENTAGSGQGLGSTFEQLAAIRSRAKRPALVGFCLDTAHLFAAGYPIHTEDGLAQVADACDRILGRALLKVIHLNDSKVPFDSRVDRHWHIGEGQIGLEAFRRIVQHPLFREAPMILETPKTTDADDRKNLATVRALLDAPRAARRTRAAAACR